jgi:hypothetical protein
MRITLLTNKAGEIICANHRADVSHESSVITTQIKPSPDQEVHEIELPDALSQHIVEGTIDREIFNYRVERTGREAKLVKGLTR